MSDRSTLDLSRTVRCRVVGCRVVMFRVVMFRVAAVLNTVIDSHYTVMCVITGHFSWLYLIAVAVYF